MEERPRKRIHIQAAALEVLKPGGSGARVPSASNLGAANGSSATAAATASAASRKPVAAARAPRARPSISVQQGPPSQKEAFMLLQMGMAQRTVRFLRPAIERARAAGLPSARLREPALLLARLEKAEEDALSKLLSVPGGQVDDTSNPCVGKLKGTRLIVFDFDRTIAKEHMWATFKDAPLASIPVDDSTFTDLRTFRAFVKAARDHGHIIAVATFGRKDVANKALSHALGSEHGVFITTPADYVDPAWSPPSTPAIGRDSSPPPHCPEGSGFLGSKNTQLAALACRFGIPAARCALFDDDEHNIEEAAKAGVSVWHTPSGLTRAVLSSAAEVLGVSRTAGVK